MLNIIFLPFRILLASIRALLVVISLVITMGLYIFITSTIVKNTPEVGYRVRRAWVKLIKIIMGVRYKLEGDIPEAPVLYVSNHRGFIDPVIIASHVDACVIAKAEVADLPLISKGATMTGIIYVKRDSKDSRSATRVAMVSQLDQGQNVLVFPEGTTNKEKHVISYKVGTFIEAAKKNIPVVPIVLEYKDEKDLWYKRSLLGQHFRQFGHLFTHARMKIGKPITHEDGIAIAKEVEAWTNHHIDQIHTEWDSHFSKIASI